MNAPVRIINRPERRGLSVAEFELLIDGGAFADCGKVELIDGDIYVMNAQFSRHGRVKMRLAFALTSRLAEIGSDLEVLTEVSMRAADDAMPEPDIALTSYRGDRAIPAETVALIVEIADTTLENDLGRKAELYAAAGVPEYWVVDCDGSRVIMHARPLAEGYEGLRDVALGEVLGSMTIEGLEVSTARLID